MSMNEWKTRDAWTRARKRAIARTNAMLTVLELAGLAAVVSLLCWVLFLI